MLTEEIFKRYLYFDSSSTRSRKAATSSLTSAKPRRGRIGANKDKEKMIEPFDSFVVDKLKEAHTKGKDLMPKEMYGLLKATYKREFEMMSVGNVKGTVPSKDKLQKRMRVIKTTHNLSE